LRDAAIFTDAPEITELTVSGITGLTDVAVPSGKTLTLTGPSNTFTAALDLSTAKGTLIVDGTLTTSGAYAITAAGTSNITINGTLALGANGSVAGEVTNNGTITTSSTTPATVTGLLGLEGTGTVEIGASLALTAAAALTQNVRIPSGVTLTTHSVAAPFSGTKTITIDESGTLALDAANTSVGVTVVNNGTITTATTSDTALQTIVNLGGAITSTGNVDSTAAFTVPVGTTLTHNTGTFVGGSGALTINGNATFTTGTFVSQTGAVTINGTASFDVATFAGLTGSAGTAIFTVGPAGNATFTAATFVGTTVGDIVINGDAEFGAAAVPGGDVKVGATGTLTVSSSGSLAVTNTKTIVVGEAPNTVTLTKATITGTAGATLVGATGTLTLTNSDILSITDTGAIVVAGDGSVALPNSKFGAGTYTAAGDVTITAVTAGDTIETAATGDKGLIIGAANTALSLLTSTTTTATYTLKNASTGRGVVFGNGAAAITVGNGTTSDTSSLEASATAKIQLGTSGNTTDAIGLGNASKLVLATGATIGVFSDTSTSVADGSGSGGASGSIGGATVTGSSSSAHKLTNTTGKLVGDAEATLTGASGGTSAITTGATLVQGSIGS
jgi:hypothetical protein